MVRETDKKYIFELFILIFFLSKKRKNQRYQFMMDRIYLQIYDPFVLGPVRLLIQLPEKLCKIWEVSDCKRVKTFIRFKAAINFNQMTSSERLYMYKTNHLPYT